MFSHDVQNLIALLSKYSGGPLRREDDLALCLQFGKDHGLAEQIGTLAFHGKFLTRLFRTRAVQGPRSEFTDKLDAEFQFAVENFSTLLREFFGDDGDEAVRDFGTRYLAMTSESIENIVALARDFSTLKDWETDMTEAAS